MAGPSPWSVVWRIGGTGTRRETADVCQNDGMAVVDDLTMLAGVV